VGETVVQGVRADDRLDPALRDLPRGRRAPLVGTAVEMCTLRQAVDLVWGLLPARAVQLVATLNVDQSLHVAEDPAVRAAFDAAALRFADGAPLVTLSRLLGARLPGRVTGADLLPAVCARAARDGQRVALLGGASGVPQEAALRLTRRYPGLQVVATLSPPLGFEQDPSADAEVVRALHEARPDLVFVCLGCPKQELWVHRRRDVLPPAVYLGVGAAVDFAAGRLVRAPEQWQRLGLEWLHRLLHDWPRLWRRYLVRDPRFLQLAAREVWLRRGAAPEPERAPIPVQGATSSTSTEAVGDAAHRMRMSA
jgi:N-acetylglucosaminyldiphosphoundecaprenol N-acetyl-beta-D-mannosaminyltransferase